MDIMKATATRPVKVAKAKNRAPADIQITAEQIILEARDRAAAAQPPPPKQHITDPEELAAHRLRVRKEFEDRLRMHRQNVAHWLRYAKWEEEQHEIERARSIYERALDIDFKNVTTWLRYAEMEMRTKFIQRARNVWDRAVTLLPRVDAFWYKYTYMEEMLGNVAGARIIFERWMAWEPPDQAWLSYIKLEVRAGQIERARGVYERYIACHPSQTAYLRYAKWEERQGQKALARRIYERGLDELRDDERDQQYYLAFGKFEERCRELERARAIFKHGLDLLPKAAAQDLYREYVSFEKQFGDRKGIEDVIVTKRRFQYEEAVKENPLNYDAWFDYIRLEESEGDAGRIREVYERAVANFPPVAEKRFWRRYVYLWIYYAVYEEVKAEDHERARAVYAAALKIVPHKVFTFGKLWLMAAHFEVRQKNLTAARKILGTSIGVCPKPKVLLGYISLEQQLGEIDRCRKLHEKYLTLWPFDVAGWAKFADLERSVGEDDRARALYELAIAQPALDMPEVAWKAFIDFEIEKAEYDRARHLYEQLLARTQHVKVWMSFAAFEASIVGDAGAARTVYSRAYDHFKGMGDDGKEPRVVLVETWHAFEKGMMEDDMAAGGDGSEYEPHVKAVEGKLPQVVTRRRPLFAADGTSLGSEEYQDYVFPDDESKPATLKLLELAAKWKAAGGSVEAVLGGSAGANAPAAVPVSGVSITDPAEIADVFDAGPLMAGSKRRADADSGFTREEADALESSYKRRPAHFDEEDVHPTHDAHGRRLPPTLPEQTALAEDTDSEDEAHAKRMEREIEDEVRAAKSAKDLPRDLYTEEDVGDAADRD